MGAHSFTQSLLGAYRILWCIFIITIELNIYNSHSKIPIKLTGKYLLLSQYVHWVVLCVITPCKYQFRINSFDSVLKDCRSGETHA